MGHSSGSALKTITERVRFLVESDLSHDTDDYIVRNLVTAAWSEILGFVNLTNQNPILAHFDFEIEEDKTQYTLPPAVAEVWCIGQFDDESGTLVSSWDPERGYNPDYTGWRVHGNTIRLNTKPNKPTGEATWTAVYVPSGDVEIHYATDGSFTDSTTFVLSSSPSLGNLDKRENAYVGQPIRFLSGLQYEERIIKTYDPTTRIATLNAPATSQGGDIVYEVGVPGLVAMQSAISARCAETMAVARSVSQVKRRGLELEKRHALKTLRDQVGHINQAIGKALEEFTIWERMAVTDANYPDDWRGY